MLKMGRLLLVFVPFVFGGLALAQSAVSSPGAESAAAEQELFRMINRDRAQAGRPELEWNEWLAQAARKHAEEMAHRGQLSHQFPGEPGVRDRIAATALRFDASGENVAVGLATAEINDDWMHSPGHRANILDSRYNAIGVAVVRSGDQLYAVTDFAHAVPALSASDLEDTVATAINQVRMRKKQPPLVRQQDPELRRYACAMARDDRVSANALLGQPNVSASLAFTDPDPANFGSHFRDIANVATSRTYAVGACFARTNTYPEGTNWVVVAFY
ncbi:MAG TPA: CAP domain-containing protein [Terriglobales bacterium]|nr:CAP domain-containing protein [Terriglobales bacterium]